MRVADKYNIDAKKLSELAEKNEYWESCFKFYRRVENFPIVGLYDKEIAWLEKMEKDLEDP